MARRRFAVALLVPSPASIEIDALRRALGDRQLGRIDPHVTIVPPINLTDEALTEAMTVVDAAASSCGPCAVTLGPVTGFGQSFPTRFLRVEPPEAVEAVYRACWTGVLEREERRSFVPHVTVDIDGAPIDGPDPAEELLAGYVVDVVLDTLTILEHCDGAWEPYTHYRLTG